MMMSLPNNKIINSLLGLLISLFALLMIECILRGGSAFYYDFRKIFIDIPDERPIYSPQLGWEERKPRFRNVEVDASERHSDAKGSISEDTSQIADYIKQKVVFLGDSNTYGYKIAEESTFVAITQKLLPDITAINLGVHGYTSYQGYQMLVLRGMAFHPDIIVVSFNFNDRRYVIDKKQIDSAERFQEIYERSKSNKIEALNNLYIYRLMKNLFIKAGIIATGTYTQSGSTPIKMDSLIARVSPDDYRKNLVNIVKLARSRGIDVILMILNDNPTETEYLVKGVNLLNKSQYDQAIEYLTVSVKKRNVFSELGRIYLEKAYRKKGMIDNADELLNLEKPWISLHGGIPIYFDMQYNKIMREVAREYNVELVDAGSELARHPSTYIDFCHFDENGHQKIAVLLSESINKILRKRRYLPRRAIP